LKKQLLHECAWSFLFSEDFVKPLELPVGDLFVEPAVTENEVIRIVALKCLEMCGSLDGFIELFDLIVIKNIVSLSHGDVHRMAYISHIRVIFF
jgi:hypothetical protein